MPNRDRNMDELINKQVEEFRKEFLVNIGAGVYVLSKDTLMSPYQGGKAIEAHLIRSMKKVAERMTDHILKGVRIEKPRHGICCTCQTCGGSKDDCYCSDNYENLLKNLSSLTDKGE